MKRLKRDFWLYLLAVAAGAVWLLPSVWTVLCSLKPPTSDMTTLGSFFAPPFTLDNYQKINGDGRMWRWMFNSFIVAVATTGLTLLVCSLMAYGLSQLKFGGKRLLIFLLALGLIVPVETTIIPAFQLVVKLGWVNTYSVLIFPGIASPVAVFVLKQFYDEVPRELVEAATVDGAGFLKRWLVLFLPLSRSSLAALAIFTFIGSWNSYLWPLLVITDQDLMTLPIAIPMYQSVFGTNVAMPMAANVFASIPAVAVFLLFQRQIVRGIAMTGLK